MKITLGELTNQLPAPETLEGITSNLERLAQLGTSLTRSLGLGGSWKQVRFPKSKRKRIRKKWAKVRRNYAWVDGPELMLQRAVEQQHNAQYDFLKQYHNVITVAGRKGW